MRFNCSSASTASGIAPLVTRSGPNPQLEKRFFGNGGLAVVAPHVPAIMVFAVYDGFAGRVRRWPDAKTRELSNAAVSNILGDPMARKSEQVIGTRWNDALGGTPKQ